MLSNPIEVSGVPYTMILGEKLVLNRSLHIASDVCRIESEGSRFLRTLSSPVALDTGILNPHVLTRAGQNLFSLKNADLG